MKWHNLEPRIALNWVLTLTFAPIALPAIAIGAAVHSYQKNKEIDEDYGSRVVGSGGVEMKHSHSFFHKNFVHRNEDLHDDCEKCNPSGYLSP